MDHRESDGSDVRGQQTGGYGVEARGSQPEDTEDPEEATKAAEAFVLASSKLLFFCCI
jgi:hypothetical protein